MAGQGPVSGTLSLWTRPAKRGGGSQWAELVNEKHRIQILLVSDV